MNEFLRHVNRIEFVVTLACTGHCKHCQEGDHNRGGRPIDADAAIRAVRAICRHYGIQSLMTFGGEPLLYPDIVCAIHRVAADCGIGQRQVITNGFFSAEQQRIRAVAQGLAVSGVNDLLLSVDAFHQETIPLEPVRLFAEAAVAAGIPVRLSPAWLVSPEDDNPYNQQTRAVLQAFADLSLPVGGNVIFPSGNALKYLGAYFQASAPACPYDEDPRDLRTISFSPNGEVLNGNFYDTDILKILQDYRP